MKFTINRKTLVRRTIAPYPYDPMHTICEMIAYETGNHVNANFVRRCIGAHRYNRVSTHEKGAKVVFEFWKELTEGSPGSARS